MTATRDGGRAKFLLEVALDRARTKQNLARVLRDQRVQRGGGDARRFPQPKMAELLGYSLRQYQRLEDENDHGLPSWDDLDAIAEKLGLTTADLFPPDEPVTEPPPDQGLADRLQVLEQQAATQGEKLDAILHLLEERRAGKRSG